MSRSYRFAAFCSLILALPLALFEAVERAVAFVFALLPTFASSPRFAVDGPALALDAPGTSLDSALQNSLRHEAGMRRLS